jgi:hypothetical protein
LRQLFAGQWALKNYKEGFDERRSAETNQA